MIRVSPLPCKESLRDFMPVRRGSSSGSVEPSSNSDMSRFVEVPESFQAKVKSSKSVKRFKSYSHLKSWHVSRTSGSAGGSSRVVGGFTLVVGGGGFYPSWWGGGVFY